MQNKRFKPLERVNGWIAAFLFIAVLLFAANGNAQTAGTGNIQGVVADGTGAVIQNAAVTVTNIATQVKHVAKTEGSGLYSFPNLAIGTYILDVTATTFEHYRQSNIVLDVGSSIAVNPVMKIGRADQTIEVQAAGLALQTEDSSLKQTIDEATVTEMPLNGSRLMTQLITLTGGAVNANENNDESGSKTFYSSAVISIGG